jgi:hypothetical protein
MSFLVNLRGAFGVALAFVVDVAAAATSGACTKMIASDSVPTIFLMLKEASS